jgi:hypothetical protein
LIEGATEDKTASVTSFWLIEFDTSTSEADAFKPQNFDQKEKGLMEAEFHHLSIASKETLAQAALGGANASYAPYTLHIMLFREN